MKSLVIALVSGLAAFSLGQNEAPVVTFTPLLVDKVYAPGTSVDGIVKITFATGLHAYQNPPLKDYQIPVKVSTASKGFAITPTYPKGKVVTLMGDEAAVYEGELQIPVKIVLPKTPGPSKLQLDISYQQCNEQVCFPSGKVAVSQTYVIKGSAKPKPKPKPRPKKKHHGG